MVDRIKDVKGRWKWSNRRKECQFEVMAFFLDITQHGQRRVLQLIIASLPIIRFLDRDTIFLAILSQSKGVFVRHVGGCRI